MSSNSNYNFGFAVQEISSLGILENLDVSTLQLTPLSTLKDKFLQKLKLDPVRVFNICTEMRSNSK